MYGEKVIISPISKWAKDDPRISINYRDISFLSATVKFCTVATSNRLSEHLEEKKLLAPIALV